MQLCVMEGTMRYLSEGTLHALDPPLCTWPDVAPYQTSCILFYHVRLLVDDQVPTEIITACDQRTEEKEATKSQRCQKVRSKL